MNRESLFSGFLIGLGATGYLALGGIPGAVIFAFGLVCVVLFGVPLYTGKAGVTNDIPALVRIWLFNIIGCALLGLLVFSLGGAPVDVWLYKNKGSILPILFGVPLFIVCGFYHSIADVTYIVAAWKWSPALLWYYPLIVLGNYVGCNIRRVTLRTS